MENGTTTLTVVPVVCQYRDKPAHVSYSVGKYRKLAKSASLGRTVTVSPESHAESIAQKGYSRELYNLLSIGLIFGPIGMYYQLKK